MHINVVLFSICLFLFLLSTERWNGAISEGGGREDVKGTHTLLLSRGCKLGALNRISQVGTVTTLIVSPSMPCGGRNLFFVLSFSLFHSETFSFVLTDVDGTRKNGYCRRLLVNDDWAH